MENEPIRVEDIVSEETALILPFPRSAEPVEIEAILHQTGSGRFSPLVVALAGPGFLAALHLGYKLLQ